MDAPRLSPIQHDYQPERLFQDQSIARVIGLLIGIVRRQFPLLIVIIALTMALGVVHLMSTPATYTAHAMLMIDSGKVMRETQQQSTGRSFVYINSAELATQLEVLKSDNIGLAVIKDQHLTGNPAFVGSTASDTRSESELSRTALGTFLGHRTVARVGESYILNIGYTAPDPGLAGQIANATADAYIVDQFESKYQTTRRANVWLQERIKDLRAQAAAADRAVFDYKEKNKIIEVGGGGTNNTSPRLLGDEQVAQLNMQLISARAAMAEANARLERINEIMNQDVPDAGTTDSLQSSVIGRLRNQYLDLAARERIFSVRYGANHLAVVNLRTQMVELRRSIADELNRIAQSYKSDYEIVKARAQTLATNLAGLISNTQLTNRDRIGLRDLESTAQVYHSIYDSFLNRYMEATQQQSFPITEARVISSATPGFKSGPNTRSILGSAAFFGVMIGFAACFLREMVDRVFRTRHQVEEVLRTNCLAVLPALTTSASDDAQGVHEQAESGERIIADRHRTFSRVVDDPRSAFAEGFRSIKVAADIAGAIRENKIIGVTSSVPKEGKSTIASNLAELMAHSGKRVILVEGDLRNRTLSRNLARGAETGLLEVLAGKIDLQHAVYTDSRTGLTFLPAMIDSRLAHTEEIVGSKMFKQLLDGLRQDYDYIIVDLPPLAPVSDARATAGIIDSYIYVIEWGQTKINVVQHHLAAAGELYDRLLGVVLSKANFKVLTRYEEYYGKNYYKNYAARYGYGG
jgi:polysaccharide biosynthesis transport protein